MQSRRIQRLNSLLRKVISDVIRKEVKNPNLTELIAVTHIEISKDLHFAKVYISVIGDEAKKKEALMILQEASGYIGIQASKQVVMRFFPKLTFVLDDTVDQQMHIDELVQKIQEERKTRESS
ncbi:MAG: 30S ribosome-binding factor RbfA [Chlamydiales bacterium]